MLTLTDSRIQDKQRSEVQLGNIKGCTYQTTWGKAIDSTTGISKDQGL